MHSNHSRDGRDTISSLAYAAADRGLREIAISDHFEPTSGNESYSGYKPQKYFEDIREAGWTFGSKIKIKAAIELGQPHRFPQQSTQLIGNHRYDYVLASAHKMADDEDFGELAYSSENLSIYCLRYLEELKGLAMWNGFDCMGHLDLIKRYAANYSLNARLADYRYRLEEILKIVIQNGKGIEVNTSGLRQASGECLPDFDIISLYRQLGGEIITIGSDAHRSEDVGKGISDAVKIIERAGFSYVTVYEDRKPRMVRITDRPSICLPGRNSA